MEPRPTKWGVLRHHPVWGCPLTNTPIFLRIPQPPPHPLCASLTTTGQPPEKDEPKWVWISQNREPERRSWGLCFKTGNRRAAPSAAAMSRKHPETHRSLIQLGGRNCINSPSGGASSLDCGLKWPPRKKRKGKRVCLLCLRKRPRPQKGNTPDFGPPPKNDPQGSSEVPKFPV